MSEKNKWKMENLLENLRKNKDAVIIIGDKAVKELELYPIDEASKKMLNKKKMVREPKYFWKYYRENVIGDKRITYSEAEKAIEGLLRTGTIKTAVNLNYTGGIDDPSRLSPVLAPVKYELIELKGNMDRYRCMSCDKEDFYTQDMLNTLSMLKCECKGKIAPSVVMFGEKYLQKNTQAVKDAIFKEEDGKVELNTHCLIFIGVDFEEDYMHDLMESYNAIKAEISTDEDPCFTVMITQGDWASIEYYQPEFATNEDIAGAISRLTAQIKEA